MKVYAVSDLHVDYPQNRDWVRRLVRSDFSADLLILAGDVSDKLTLLEECLRELRSAFMEVLFVPGNHDLWVDRQEFDCSLTKFEALQSLCDQLGVRTEPFHSDQLSIVPLLSWYDFSFGEPDRYLRRAWRDFRSCQWPDRFPHARDVAAYFHELNESRLQAKNDTVISFSHFLPSLTVMPDQIPAHRRRVYPVLGSTDLGRQVRRLQPDIHVYGHSHVNQAVELDNVQYVNNAFAYPDEARIARKALHCVWERPA